MVMNLVDGKNARCSPFPEVPLPPILPPRLPPCSL